MYGIAKPAKPLHHKRKRCPQRSSRTPISRPQGPWLARHWTRCGMAYTMLGSDLAPRKIASSWDWKSAVKEDPAIWFRKAMFHHVSHIISHIISHSKALHFQHNGLPFQRRCRETCQWPRLWRADGTQWLDLHAIAPCFAPEESNKMPQGLSSAQHSGGNHWVGIRHIKFTLNIIEP